MRTANWPSANLRCGGGSLIIRDSYPSGTAALAVKPDSWARLKMVPSPNPVSLGRRPSRVKPEWGSLEPFGNLPGNPGSVWTGVAAASDRVGDRRQFWAVAVNAVKSLHLLPIL